VPARLSAGRTFAWTVASGHLPRTLSSSIARVFPRAAASARAWSDSRFAEPSTRSVAFAAGAPSMTSALAIARRGFFSVSFAKAAASASAAPPRREPTVLTTPAALSRTSGWL